MLIHTSVFLFPFWISDIPITLLPTQNFYLSFETFLAVPDHHIFLLSYCAYPAICHIFISNNVTRQRSLYLLEWGYQLACSKMYYIFIDLNWSMLDGPKRNPPFAVFLSTPWYIVSSQEMLTECNWSMLNGTKRLYLSCVSMILSPFTHSSI